MQDILAQTSRAFLKPIEAFLNDPEVSEIMINGPHEIYVEKKGKLIKTTAQFEDEEQLMAAVRNIAQFVGRKIEKITPILDARLADGSRIHVIIPPCARKGICMTIRKFARDEIAIKDLVKFASLSVESAKFLNLCVTLAKNMIVSGGTSSGKTTLLNVLSELIPDDQRIVVLEDATELQLRKEHVLSMETQAADTQGKGEVTMRHLLKSALRLRPDRIVIGEVRGGEAMDLLQAMNTGHSGSMSTVHANNPRLALSRLETLALMGEVEIPLAAVRSQVSSAVEIIVQASRLRDGSRRVTHITEILGLDAHGNYKTADVFVLKLEKSASANKISGKLVPTGYIPSFIDDAELQGYPVSKEIFKAN
jgi:pilus assembly protein CpaF